MTLASLATLLAGAALAVGSAAYRRAAAAAAAPTGPVRVRVIDGRARRELTDDTRDYALYVSVHNGAVADVHITSIGLRVTYLTRANFLGVVDLQPATAPEGGALPVPLTLRAGETVAGWLFFHTSNVIPRHCRVDDYTLLLMTADGRRVKVDAALPAILAADTDGDGPATWGWD